MPVVCGLGATTSVERSKTLTTTRYSVWSGLTTAMQVSIVRSRTTLPCGPRSRYARSTFGVNPTEDDDNGHEASPFPKRCPRCQNYRSPDGRREIIEPLRTRGPRSISVVMEDTLRVQPDIGGPNGAGGRKALVFSDSRQDAAQLAGDLRRDHKYDVFRQLLYRILHTCRKCG